MLASLPNANSLLTTMPSGGQALSTYSAPSNRSSKGRTRQGRRLMTGYGGDGTPKRPCKLTSLPPGVVNWEHVVACKVKKAQEREKVNETVLLGWKTQ